MAKRAKDSTPEGENSRVVDPLLDAPAEVRTLPGPPPVQTPPARTGPTFGQRVRSCLGFFLRVVLSVIVLSAFVLALYFGLPLINDPYAVPAAQNSSPILELQSRQQQTEQDLGDLQTRLQTLEEMQNQQDSSLTELSQRLDNIETEIAARTESLAGLEELQSELQAQDEAAAQELERQFNLLKSMELLSRAHLFMYQSNFGLARQDVRSARDLLATVHPDAPGPLAAELDEVIRRLDLALSNLPDFPVAASDDLDIAWRILLTGLPKETATATPPSAATASATPVGTSTATPPENGQATATATP